MSPQDTLSSLDQGAVIPRPVSIEPAQGKFELGAAAVIYVDGGSEELAFIGQYLAEKLRPSTGFDLPVKPAAPTAEKGGIALTLADSEAALGDEGYTLEITPEQVRLRAPRPAGLFHGVQTLRQLLPAAVDEPIKQPGPWFVPAGVIRDLPRLAYRGMMLDVARHFFGVADVERLIDLIAYYKMNTLHLHLSDDQGWRIAIQSWPRLAELGGLTSVKNENPGFYTQAQYRQIVAYAASRYVTIVPEIDTPGHTNAALASYAELNCDGAARQPFTGIQVGFSSLCIGKDITYTFLDDVIGELAALTPGPYIHIGGDEAHSTAEADYVQFIEKIQPIVQAHGKQMIGWEEVSKVKLLPGSVAQAWVRDTAALAAQQGNRVIFSPASKTYLDMQYNAESPLGLHWAGYVEVQDAYDWDPAATIEGVGEKDVLGVEAPLWSETLRSIDDIEYMVFPRLPGIAEVGWSPQDARKWDEYRVRLAAHGPRFRALGINYYPSTQVDWK